MDVIAFDTMLRIAGRHYCRAHPPAANDQGYWATLSDALFDQSIHWVD